MQVSMVGRKAWNIQILWLINGLIIFIKITNQTGIVLPIFVASYSGSFGMQEDDEGINRCPGCCHVVLP